MSNTGRPTRPAGRIPVPLRTSTSRPGSQIPIQGGPPDMTKGAIPKVRTVTKTKRVVEEVKTPAGRRPSTGIPVYAARPPPSAALPAASARPSTSATTRRGVPVPRRAAPQPIIEEPPSVSRRSRQPIIEEPSSTVGSSRSSAGQLVRAASRPHTSSRSRGTRTRVVPPPYIMTDHGPVQATHQMVLQQTVKRYPEQEVISRRMVGTKVNEFGQADQCEIALQHVEPGGLRASRRQGGIPLHEVVSVTSSITVAPGARERVITTTYSSTSHSKMGGRGVQPKPSQVMKMITAEAEDVTKLKQLEPPELVGSSTEVFGLKKKIQEMKLSPEVVRRLESSIIRPLPSADEPQEETEPEVLAAIMHTEEKGLTMDAPPTNVYNYLFPDAKDNIVMQVSPAAPAPLENVVVPAEIPSELHVSGVTPEVQQVAEEALATQPVPPADNAFTKSVLKEEALPKLQNTTTKAVGPKVRRRKVVYRPITEEKPPFQIEDIQPVINLVGAPPDADETALNISETEPIFHNEEENSLEYHLVLQPPRHVSRVQLRGTQKPPWFPGYYVALPENFKVERDPNQVISSAWQAVQPDIFSDDSFVLVG